jgi:hypothetical protein
VPPGCGGLALQASRHNTRREAGLTAGADVVMGAGGGLAIGLEAGLAGAGGLGVGDEPELAADSDAQALAVATAKPAVPANWSSWRRLSPGPPSSPAGGDASMRSRYDHSMRGVCCALQAAALTESGWITKPIPRT